MSLPRPADLLQQGGQAALVGAIITTSFAILRVLLRQLLHMVWINERLGGLLGSSLGLLLRRGWAGLSMPRCLGSASEAMQAGEYKGLPSVAIRFRYSSTRWSRISE